MILHIRLYIIYDITYVFIIAESSKVQIKLEHLFEEVISIVLGLIIPKNLINFQMLVLN